MKLQEHRNRTLFFLFSREDVDLVCKKFSADYIKESVFISVGVTSYLAINKLNIKAYQYENFFPEKKARDLDRKAKEWSKNWFKKVFKSKKYRISLESLDLTLYSYFSKKLFQYFALKSFVSKFNIDTIYLGNEDTSIKSFFVWNFDSLTPVIYKLCIVTGIKINHLRPNFMNFLNINLLKKMIAAITWHKQKFEIIGEHSANILFLGHHYHLTNLLPLIKSFGIKNTLITGNIANRKHLIRLLGHLSTKKYQLGFLQKTNIFARKIELLISSFEINNYSVRKYFTIEGENFYDLFADRLESLFVLELPRYFLYSIYATDLIKKTNIKVLVNLTEDLFIRAFIEAAKKRAIPTIQIQHGFTVGSDSEFTTTDKFIVWGQLSRNIYSRTGMDITKIIMGGWPAFDVYRKQKSKKRGAICFLAQDPDGPSLMFMKRTPIDSFETFFESVSDLKNTKILIRLHPRADKNIPSLIAKKHGVAFEFAQDDELSTVLSRSGIVVGQTTSATLDAIIAHKSVVYLSSMKWPSKFVESSGSVYEVDNANELRKVIKDFINGGENKKLRQAQIKFVKNYCNFPNDSTKIINNIITAYI